MRPLPHHRSARRKQAVSPCRGISSRDLATGLLAVLMLAAAPAFAQSAGSGTAPPQISGDRPAAAPGGLVFDFPAPAVETASRSEALASYNLAIGPFAKGRIPSRTVEGRLTQTAWRIETGLDGGMGMTTLQLLAPLRAQLITAGYRVIFECEAVDCGGFDFRYGTDVLLEPDMHVDMGDFRYLAAERDGAKGRDLASLIVSRAGTQGFVQLTRIDAAQASPGADVPPSPGQEITLTLPPPNPAEDLAAAPDSDDDDGPEMALSSSDAPDPADASPALPELEMPELPAARLSSAPADTTAEQPQGSTDPGDPGAVLLARGAVALDDLVFASGAGELTAGDYGSLAALARWLKADPAREIAVVGHTDASGGLEANMALSLKRAQSVRAALLAEGVAAAQVEAQGVGPLAPRDSNLTPEGRDRNRRVEAMLLTTAP